MARGRVFVLTVDTGESFRRVIETFCSENSVSKAKVTILGGMQSGSSFVSGPVMDGDREAVPIVPTIVSTDAPTEFFGIGTVFPDEKGAPVLHLHGSIGREGGSSTGCFRENAIAWLTMEVVIEELIGPDAVRRYDGKTGVSPLNLG